MKKNEMHLKHSKSPRIGYKKRYNISLNKFLITSYKDKIQNNQNKILKNNSIKNTSRYNYKDPFFYNDNNLDLQLKILKALKNIEITPNSSPESTHRNINTNHTSCKSFHSTNFINNGKEKRNILSWDKIDYKNNKTNINFPYISKNINNNNIQIEINDNSKDDNKYNIKRLIKKNFSFDNISNNKSKYNCLSSRNLKENDEYFYKMIFNSKPIFSDKKLIIDNKLNMIYAENEEQYEKIIEKENNKLILKGKKVKSKNFSPSIKLKLDETKNSIKFMKGILDYSFPSFIITKLNI